jgi:Family of unknown function (DUF6527)
LAKLLTLHYNGPAEQITDVLFFCPGCQCGHRVRVHPPGIPGLWTWNNDVNKPTFTPSILVNASNVNQRCHSFVTDGKIQFLTDCYHELRGQTVELDDDF